MKPVPAGLLLFLTICLILLSSACGASKSPRLEAANPQVSVEFFWLDKAKPDDPSVFFVGRVKNPGHKTLQQTTVRWQYKSQDGSPLGDIRSFTLPNLGAGAGLDFAASETTLTLKAPVSDAAGVDLKVGATGIPVDTAATPLLKVMNVELTDLKELDLRYKITATLTLPKDDVAASKLQRWVVLRDDKGNIVGGDGGGLLSDGSLSTLPGGSQQQVTFPSIPAKSTAKTAVVYSYVAQ